MRIGVLGGGQLGRMLALAGYPLGLTFRFLDSSPDAPAGQVGELLVSAFDDDDALARFATGLDAITYEFENVPVTSARRLAERLPLHPSLVALETAQDRLAEKRLFHRLEIPTPPFVPVDDRAGLDEAVKRLGLPAVLKTRRFGYDGKGQVVMRVPPDVSPAWELLGGQPLVLETFVDFQRELSVLAVAARDGDARFYPLVENTHRDGILRTSLAPAPSAAPRLQALAEAHATRVLEALGYVGVLAIEFFQVGDRLVANEMAPRVHNSGHWTIEGAETSQFENHLRAVLGLPLGGTAPRGTSLMLNLVGTLPDPAAVLAVPGAHLHLYGKEPRPGRKLGHITVRVDSADALASTRERLAAIDEI